MAIEVIGRYQGVATLAGHKVIVDLTATQHVHSARGQPIGGIPEWHGKAIVESDGAGDVWDLWSDDAAAELVVDARTGTIKIAGMDLSSGGAFDLRGEGVPPFDVKTI